MTITRYCLLAVWLVLLVQSGPAMAQSGASSTATGISRLMNPAISLNALLLGEVSRDIPTRAANQISLQEMEIQFAAVVDPFWTATLIVAMHPEHAHEGEEAHTAHFAVDVEQAIVEYRNMPRGFGLRLGKDFLNFGKQIPLHTHNFAFVKAPVGISAFVGDHGLTETGAELAWNAPLPWWAEVKVYATSATAALFNAESRDLLYGARMSNMWDTSVASTLELGFSGLTGPGAAHGASQPAGRWNMYGADLTWKWLPGTTTGGPALNFTNEVLLPDPEHKVGDPLGFYSHLQYRFARQWWFGVGGSVARDALPEHDHDAEPGAESGLHTIRQVKANVTLTPSEFSAVRLEVHYDEEVDGDFRDLGAYLQVNFTIGSHPAHAY